MDIVTILRDLWRRRLLVVAVYLIALLAGTAVVYKISFPPRLESRKYEVGIATARILVDTPSSQVVEVAPKGSDSLGVRANLLASLMVDGVVKSAIARRAGLEPDELVGVTKAAEEPGPTTRPGPGAFVLTTRVLTNTGGEQMPIIELDAQGPDRAAAARLATAALEGLRDYLDSKAALQQVPNAARLQVTGLGAPQATAQVKGPSKAIAVVVVLFVFGLGCACILAASAFGRGWRAAEELADTQLLADEDVLLGEAPKPLAAAPTPARAVARREERSADSWLTASPRPALVVRPPADEAVERDAPQAKSA